GLEGDRYRGQGDNLTRPAVAGELDRILETAILPPQATRLAAAGRHVEELGFQPLALQSERFARALQQHLAPEPAQRPPDQDHHGPQDDRRHADPEPVRHGAIRYLMPSRYPVWCGAGSMTSGKPSPSLSLMYGRSSP